MCSSSSVSRFLKRFSATKKSPPRPFDEKKERKRTPFSSFRRPLLKPLLPFCPRPTRSAEKKRKRGREGRDLLFDLLFVSLSSSSSERERERERRKRERCLHSSFFFSLFLFCGGGETCDLFTSRRVSKDFERRRRRMELPRGARPPPDEYFASDFNVINNDRGRRDSEGGGDASPKWSLRGFLPPAHLRIELYRYANRDVRPEESEEESPAGRLTPTPRTPQRQMNGESTEMLTGGVLL